VSTPRVLLVEDEELNRVLVRAILARAGDPELRGIELVEAASLASARDRLADGEVDVVLLDVNLPDGNGLTLAAELAARGGDDRPQVVALTASVLPHERAAAMTAGCDAFLDKPYAAAELIGIITEQLQRARD
jgi:two-component system KDP operon response regulator KdpE